MWTQHCCWAAYPANPWKSSCRNPMEQDSHQMTQLKRWCTVPWGSKQASRFGLSGRGHAGILQASITVVPMWCSCGVTSSCGTVCGVLKPVLITDTCCCRTVVLEGIFGQHRMTSPCLSNLARIFCPMLAHEPHPHFPVESCCVGRTQCSGTFLIIDLFNVLCFCLLWGGYRCFIPWCP